MPVQSEAACILYYMTQSGPRSRTPLMSRMTSMDSSMESVMDAINTYTAAYNYKPAGKNS